MTQNTPPKRQYALRSQETLNTIQTLMRQGVDRMSVILRHSDRHYHRDPMMEPFMGLTEEGKSYAFDLGSGLPATLLPRLFASHFSRCVETAYLIDKGFTRATGALLSHTETCDLLAPFYIKEIKEALGLMMAQGSQAFIRSWFDRAIDPEVMEDPLATADKITGFMLQRLEELEPGQIALCASHDWNIFPVREFKLGLPHETFGDVGYLDGVVFFKDKGQAFAATFQTAPKAI